IEQFQNGEVEDVPGALLANLASLKSDIDAFRAIGRSFKAISWVFAYIPIVLSLVTVLLFVLSIKGLLREIVLMPERVVRGEATASQVLGVVARAIGWEVVITLCMLLILFGATMAADVAMSEMMWPTVNAFIDYIVMCGDYVLQPAPASTGLIYGCLGGVLG